MEIGYLQEVKAIIKSLVISCPQPNKMTLQTLMADYKNEEGHDIPFRKLGFQTVEQFLRSVSDTVILSGYGPSAIVRPVSNEKSAHIQNMICEQKRPSTGNKKNMNKPRIQQPANYVQRHGVEATPNLQRQVKQIPYQQQQQDPKLQQQQNSNKIATCQLRFSHAAHYNTKLDTSFKCGGYNLNRYVQHAGHNISNGRQNQCNGAFCSPSSSEKETSNEMSSTTKEKFSYKDNSCKSEDLQLNKSFKKYVTLDTPENSRKTEEETDSSCSKSSIRSPRQMFVDALLSAKNSQQTAEQEMCKAKQNIDEAVPASALNDLIYRLDFPENTVVFGRKIESYKMPEDIKKGSIIAIFISEVHDPYKFWFHMHKKSQELEILVNDIERFYMTLYPEELCIPELRILPGVICAAQYQNIWYRAEVLSPVIAGKAKVLYLDYGTVLEVDIEHIKYLLSRFAALPTQAFRGSLSHIKPYGLHWEPAATHYFSTLVSATPIYAQVAELDEVNRVFHMILCNTTRDVDIQINKTLVDKGFALYDEEWKEENIKKINQRIRHPRESFPTFSMLESGMYPTFLELTRLKDLHIDYETIIDNQIFHPSVLNEIKGAPECLRNLPFNLLQTNPFRLEIVLQLGGLM